ncbi:hypothetical protein [uncultured Williamsia sp.]|uniref:hypothetical protein n=1 Tax=uncultured Williamsia sp. TaxID=259311 RepID=UPI00260DAD38|nr:hypothetical protein [uncultured Williamsia sp.]
MTETLPDVGVVFWPVGTGDSSTVVVSEEILVQVDLNDREKADDEANPEVPVVDLLVDALPIGSDGRPFLAAFVLTHADKDHCSGFADLLEKATIGELWATPRMWRELADDPDAALCEDAQAFHKEVRRRVDAVKKAVAAGDEIDLGDRVIVVGYDTAEAEHSYHDLPEEYLVKPGNSVTKINGVDYIGRFNAFIHAPFKDDCAAARNETSLSMQVTLTDDNGLDVKVLLFGDLAYDTIIKIFNYSEGHSRQEFLEWNLLLAPHHCSKKVMYVVEDGEDTLKSDILDKFEEYSRDDAVVVASSQPIPTTDKAGANPPHRKAANRYQDRFEFICTMEWPSIADPSPVVLAIGDAGAHIVDDEVVELAAHALTASVAAHQRLTRVAAAATTAGRAVATQLSAGAAQTQTGPERVRSAVEAGRGQAAAPTTTVGFGRA